MEEKNPKITSKKALLFTGGGIAVILVACLIWLFVRQNGPVQPAIQQQVLQTVQHYISPTEISISDGFAYTADATRGMVYKTNLATGAQEASFEAGVSINGVYAADGNVYALAGGLDGRVIKLDTSLQQVAEAQAGHTPVEMLAVDGKLYLANRFSNTVGVYHADSLELEKEIAVSREPMAMAEAGGMIYVASHLSEAPANAEVTSASITVIDPAKGEVVKEIPLLNGSVNVKDICASPDGKYLYTAHVLARYAYPTSQVDRGWIETNAVTILDAETQEVLTSVLLDEVEHGAANPWGIRCTDTALVVSLAGTHEVMIIDTAMLFDKIAAVEAGQNQNVDTVLDIPNYIPFLDGARTRIELDGQGPRALEIADGKAYICQYFTGDLAVLDLETQTVTSCSLGEQPEPDDVRKGEILWHDASNTYQQWLSCSSCHPDARMDSLSWDELNDGLGNPKSTKGLVYSHRTPPCMATGVAENGEEGVKGSPNVVMTDEEFACMDAYLKSLAPVPSPMLNRDGTLTEEALQGKEIFEQAGCISCHTGPNFTDQKSYPPTGVDPVENGWENRDMDTPTLVEVWRTGPWLFDGRVADLVVSNEL